MTTEEITHLFKTIRYKPGTKFEWVWLTPDRFRFSITLMQPSLNDDGTLVPIELGKCYSRTELENLEQDKFINLISQSIKHMESHEVDERLWINGKRPYEPHPDRLV